MTLPSAILPQQIRCFVSRGKGYPSIWLKFGNCREPQMTDIRVFPNWSLINGSSRSGWMKANITQHKSLSGLTRSQSFISIHVDYIKCVKMSTVNIPKSALQWHHNERDGVSNHQPHDCSFNRLFRHRSKKTSKLRVTGLCEGNSAVTVEFPAQRASNAESYSIWWHHHGHRGKTRAELPRM